MARTLFESIEQHSSTISISCSSVQKTTLGEGVQYRLRTAGSFLDRSRRLANWSLSSFSFKFWRAFLTCFISPGMSAMTSACKISPVLSTDSSKILEGPLWLFTFSRIAFLVDGAVETKLCAHFVRLYVQRENFYLVVEWQRAFSLIEIRSCRIILKVLSGLPKNANVKTESYITEGRHSESDTEP